MKETTKKLILLLILFSDDENKKKTVGVGSPKWYTTLHSIVFMTNQIQSKPWHDKGAGGMWIVVLAFRVTMIRTDRKSQSV